MRSAKAALRARMAAVRDALPAPKREAAGVAIRERLLALPEWAAARTVFVYVPFRSEVQTWGILAAALSEGKRVLAPRVDRAAREIRAVEIAALADLAPGEWGILEPPATAPAADPLEVDLVVAPGLAFDARGGRLGYGAGYYDRYLRRIRPDCPRIGLAYEAQIVPEVPCGPGDQRLHAVVTEARVLRVG